MKIVFKPGKYFIGDISYVMHNDWSEFCSDHYESDGMLSTLSDGRQFWFHGTYFGDGYYQDNNYHEYPVDAGILGIININDIKLTEHDDITLGNEVDFSEPFAVSYDSKTGIFYFGHITIETDDSGRDEYEEEDDEDGHVSDCD